MSVRDDSALSHTMTKEEFKAKKFGLPKLKKFPMPDAAHVRSAIKFFNYATPSQERELANAILARMDEYGINPDDINVGDNNRFKRYLMESYLEHHGIKGQKWGVRRYQNKDGSLTRKGFEHYRKSVQYTNEVYKSSKQLRDALATARSKSTGISAKKLDDSIDILDSTLSKIGKVKLSGRPYKKVVKDVNQILNDAEMSLNELNRMYG